MQVDFDFAPTGVAMFGQPGYQRLIVLLRRVEVGMNERATFRVTEDSEQSRVLAAPALEAALLFRVRSACRMPCPGTIDGSK